MRRFVVFLVAGSMLATVSSETRVDAAMSKYVLPVSAAVSRTFDAPANYYAAGNRGVEFAVQIGTPVRASSSGKVLFAGAIGSNKYVSIQHDDGVRTTYSYLSVIRVATGDAIGQSQIISLTSKQFQWGARIGEHAYLDPLTLVDNPTSHLKLVADENFVAAMAPLATATVDDVVLGWLRGRSASDCANVTAETDQLKVMAPRRALLVGGLGTETGGTSLNRIDFESLGYSADAINQFSYLGGDAKTNPYVSKDTQQDLAIVVPRLVDFIAEQHKKFPDEPIDLYAHSMGGLVVRAALNEIALTGKDYGVVNVVTIASPHNGAELARIASALAQSKHAEDFKTIISEFTDLDISAPEISQLDPRGQFIASLQNAQLPENVRAVSIAARNDPVVPAINSWWPGADNVVVQAHGEGNPHSFVAGDIQTLREIRLTLAGLGPSCESSRAAVADYFVSSAIAGAESVVANALAERP